VKVLPKKRLRNLVIGSLRRQGYQVRKGAISLPDDLDKDGFRQLHRLAVEKRITASRSRLERWEALLLDRIANGSEVDPSAILPKLVRVIPRSNDELLFRYAALHWSIPVSAGYGRRLRFLVLDESNGKLIGLFGLGDPVYALRARDQWIGWTKEAKKQHLYHVLDAYVLGAVPPYSFLLCSKLVAMLALSNEVREVFRRKYRNSRSLITKARRMPHLTLLTTTSALGRSSVYNRIRVDGFEYWSAVGFTEGSGEFHFSNGIYADVRAFAESRCLATAKKQAWGTGFRNKREVIKKCLPKIGLSSDLLYHGVRREIFVAPLASNALAYLKGEEKSPKFYDLPAKTLAALFLKRWLVPRATRDQRYKDFKREQYRLKSL